MTEFDAIIATSSRLERPLVGHSYYPQTISGSAQVHNGDSFKAYNNTFVLSLDVAKEAFDLKSMLGNADDACKQLCAGLIKCDSKSDQKLSIQRDTESLCSVLDTLRALLSYEYSMESAVWAALSDNMNKIISDCMEILADLNTWTETPGLDREIERKGKAPEIKKLSVAEVEALRKDMNSIRISLSLAIATANWVQSKRSVDMMIEDRKLLLSKLCQMEDDKAAQLPPAVPHNAIDRSTVRTDTYFTIKRYLNSNKSTHAGTKTPAEPSMRGSSYLMPDTSCSDSLLTFNTAPTRITILGYTQVLISGVPGRQTMIVQVERHYTVGHLKDEIRNRLELPYASFNFIYLGKVLSKESSTLGAYEVQHLSTLTCVSFRSDDSKPGLWTVTIKSRPDFVFVRETGKPTFAFHLRTAMESTLLDIAFQLADYPSEVRLTQGDRELPSDAALTSENFEIEDDGSMVLLAHFQKGACRIHNVHTFDELVWPAVPAVGHVWGATQPSILFYCAKIFETRTEISIRQFNPLGLQIFRTDRHPHTRVKHSVNKEQLSKPVLCRSCYRFVEPLGDSIHITCPCTTQFCLECGLKWKTCDCMWFDSSGEEDSTVATAVTRRSRSWDPFISRKSQEPRERWPPRAKNGVKRMTRLGQKGDSISRPLSTIEDDESYEDEESSSSSWTVTIRQPNSEMSMETEQTTVRRIRGLFRRRPSKRSLVETLTARGVPQVPLKTRLKWFGFKGWGKGGM